MLSPKKCTKENPVWRQNQKPNPPRYQSCFEERSRLGPDGLALYQYPPEIEDSPDLPEGLKTNLTTKNQQGTVMVAVWSISEEMR